MPWNPDWLDSDWYGQWFGPQGENNPGAMSGTAAGSSSASASLVGVGHIAGSVAGVASATGTLSALAFVSGLSAGSATATGTLTDGGTPAPVRRENPDAVNRRRVDYRRRRVMADDEVLLLALIG